MEDVADLAIETGLNAGASFVDIRIEYTRKTNLDVVNEVTRNTILATEKGAGIRAFVNGSWAFGYTSDVTKQGIRKASESIAKMAVTASKWVEEQFEIEAPSFQDRIEYKAKTPIDETPVEYKIEQAKQLSKDMSETDVRVKSSRIIYRDVYTELYVANSLGTMVKEETGRIVFIPMCTAKDEKSTQQSHIALGLTGGLGDMPDDLMLMLVEEPARIALSLLSSKAVKGGVYDVIVDPPLNGAMIHEAFGHACEGDSLTGGSSVLQDRMGTCVGPEHINLIDDPTLKGHVASFSYDWEGTRATRKQLVKNGVLNEFMHSLDTASRLEMETNGAARAMTFMYPPIPRMSNTFMEPGDWNLDELIEDTKEGIIMCNVDYGYTDSTKGSFMFKSVNGQLIENGERTDVVRDASIAGQILDILPKIDAICNDFFYDAGSCGTQGQMAWVMSGGPHIRLRQVPVGGV
ncbi:MAG: TldD/PmbA family protein [Candidatus Thorarchaeota archaeon]|nr:MAG: TldD/PmbA family protein [Candidatus Thorarchaeota archaeon]